jgi:hypothetical protein
MLLLLLLLITDVFGLDPSWVCIPSRRCATPLGPAIKSLEEYGLCSAIRGLSS